MWADNVPLTAEQKATLDEVHKRKIDNSEGIFVVDVDNYIGESTRSEIDYAENNGKFVKYLSTFPDLKTIADMVAIKRNVWGEQITKTDYSKNAGRRDEM
jgi:hypothetical protein